ncbi:GL15295 [Drosophila persimilis]|uniref:GL15295 n=1 Tax=Drosophila persimilis TaxID=7234 RepID=B4H9F5_DROPE|nr:GL15295 [Drosophila persimilis]
MARRCILGVRRRPAQGNHGPRPANHQQDTTPRTRKQNQATQRSMAQRQEPYHDHPGHLGHPDPTVAPPTDNHDLGMAQRRRPSEHVAKQSVGNHHSGGDAVIGLRRGGPSRPGPAGATKTPTPPQASRPRNRHRRYPTRDSKTRRARSPLNIYYKNH